MKVSALAILLLGMAFACSDAGVPSPAAFEIREFSTTGDFNAYGGGGYISQGTVVALDARLKEGSYAVVLQYREKGNAHDRVWREVVVYVTNGLGTMKVAKYVPSEAKGAPAPEYEWRMLGYARLLPAKLTVQ